MKLDLNRYDAVLFDMDGLMLDTERLCWECFRDTCISFGHDPDFEKYKQCIGRNTDEGNRILSELFGKDIPYDKVNRIWNSSYGKLVESTSLPLKKGLVNFLNILKEKRIQTGVVTSTAWELATGKLTNSRLIDYFDIIVSGDQVKASKPRPDIYLKAAEKLSKEPSKCLAFEDSTSGVIAALEAGMTVIQIPDLIEPDQDLISRGHRIIESFDKIEIL